MLQWSEILNNLNIKNSGRNSVKKMDILTYFFLMILYFYICRENFHNKTKGKLEAAM